MLFATLLATTAIGQSAETVDPFPATTALAEGVSPVALERLDGLVKSFIETDEVVGAELLVIKNGRTLLHEAYGVKDRQSGASVETGSVFCVRSMTKPVIGTAILMMIEDHQIDLDDPIAKYLPAFDVDGKREITVEHLLMHTSGLPFSLIAASNPRELESLAKVVDMARDQPLEFEPGTGFQYSDQGTDTLTRLIEIVTERDAAEFLRERVLDPLEMHSSTFVMAIDDPLRERALPLFIGARGAWRQFWAPDEEPLFPFFLGSQGLYSTTEDYARFMELWLRKGRAGKQRLLRPSSVRKALTPNPHPFPGGLGLPKVRGSYGYLMQLWIAKAPTDAADEAPEELVAFGHGGSDGTHAWVFPEQNAIVMYFTQSRGTTTGLQVEDALGELFLGEPFDANQLAPPLDEYLGYYWEGEGDLYRAIVRDGNDLALEILGRGVIPLTFIGEDRWKLRPSPTEVIRFDRDADGTVTGYHVGDHQEFRFEPSAELKTVEDIQQRVNAAYRMDLLESLGTLHTRGSVEIDKIGHVADFEMQTSWPDQYRMEGRGEDMLERVTVDGPEVWYESTMEPLAQLVGERAAFVRRDQPLARYGDWSRWHATKPEVIQKIMGDGRDIYLVRMGGTDAPTTTLYVEYESGLVRMEDGLTIMGGAGRIGYRTKFEDFREIEGMRLPFVTRSEVPHPAIGTITTTITGFELVDE